MAKSQKKKTWEACSRFVRFQEALEYCKERGINLSQFDRPEDVIGQCVTCGSVKSWSRMDCGHCISRGSGGLSGVYFERRNLGLQCKQCNGFHQGRFEEFQKHIEKKYGKGTMAELELLDKTNSYKYQLEGLELYFKNEYKKLVKEIEK